MEGLGVPRGPRVQPVHVRGRNQKSERDPRSACRVRAAVIPRVAKVTAKRTQCTSPHFTGVGLALTSTRPVSQFTCRTSPPGARQGEPGSPGGCGAQPGSWRKAQLHPDNFTRPRLKMKAAPHQHISAHTQTQKCAHAPLGFACSLGYFFEAMAKVDCVRAV